MQYCDASYLISYDYLHGENDENNPNVVNFVNSGSVQNKSVEEIDAISISD